MQKDMPSMDQLKKEEERYRKLQEELTAANEKMQDIINAIPGGVAIYKVTDIFQTVYFSDGVPELSGYTVEEYRELIKKDAAEMTYWEDTAMVVARAKEVIESRGLTSFEFRKQHRDGHIVWVRVQIKWIGEEDGCPLLHCVFHNISDLKEAQLELQHMINSIPGGIASYRVEEKRFIPTFFSDGVMALSGHTREEYEEIVKEDALNIICDQDRERVLKAAQEALISGEVLDISYRMRHKDGNLIWIHLNGRRMGPLADVMRFYAVFTGMSAETRFFQTLANETADGIYVISKENYELLYVNEAENFFAGGRDCVGQKCYMALHRKASPCSFCTIKTHEADGVEHEMKVSGTGRFYTTRFRETDWNGIPAYIKFVRDITDEVVTRKEKERLEKYFQTVLKNLPGGVVVFHYEKDGSMKPEFMSDGFAAMTGMTPEETWELYRDDAMAGVHPLDREYVADQMEKYTSSDEPRWEMVYRLKKGDGDYLWVKNTLSLIENEGGEGRIYAVYQDMTKTRKEQEELRQKYQDMILQHYHTYGADTLALGHCNVTQNRILEMNDYTGLDMLNRFGAVREEFFTGVGSLIVDEEERRDFYGRYLNKPTLDAFRRGETKQQQEYFIKLPNEEKGRYVCIEMNLVSTPDSGDVTGVLTVTDITAQVVSDRILYQLSSSGYDFVADVDLTADSFTILSHNKGRSVPPHHGCHSEWVRYLLDTKVVPRDKQRFRENLDIKTIKEKLQKSQSYTFAYSIMDEKNGILTKNLTVSAVDMRIGRVCLSRADITDSVREQQRLLRVIAYTFELAGFIDIGRRCFTLYTREAVLNNLPPHFIERYDDCISRFVSKYVPEENQAETCACFQAETMMRRLEEKPGGYDFLFPYSGEDGARYKQVNVMWGDINHSTICLVRADVTEMLAAERENKKALEDALVLAEEANQAKSDFLSAMSHDIRTPMNAIMGMTTLARAHLNEKERVSDCLDKISISSRHLLSLINDILDMSKIESAQISLNQMEIYLPDMLKSLSAIISPQAKENGLWFEIQTENIRHLYFYGDSLRINQILINILSNAVKYTHEGGHVKFTVEEVPPVKNMQRLRYRFTVSDTGVGMPAEFLEHIFEPFNRSYGSEKIEGTGLGLSITKGLVDLMDGEISVQSELGRGSTFKVELEFEHMGEEVKSDETGAAEVPQDSADEKPFEGRRFLVAEDNEINAEILCELLSMYGAQTVAAADGTQAVREFEDASPGTYDAILMDIQMPVMNGYDATRIIRKMEREDARQIPIIAMTANAFAEDVESAKDAGMTAHVAKPIDTDVLKQTLVLSLQGHGWV